MRALVRNVYPFLVVLAAWQLLVTLGPFNDRLFPSVASTAAAVGAVWSRGDYQLHTAATIGRVLAGLAAALVAGVALGSLMARSKRAEALLEPVFSASYAVPRLAVYPVLVLMFGATDLTRILLIFGECLYPITVSTYHGAQLIRPSLVWAAQSMGASGPRLAWRVIAPASLPSILTGLRIAAPIGLIVGVVVEMIGANSGLGYAVMVAGASFRPAEILALSLAIALAGYLLDRAILALRHRLVVWEGPSA